MRLCKRRERHHLLGLGLRERRLRLGPCGLVEEMRVADSRLNLRAQDRADLVAQQRGAEEVAELVVAVDPAGRVEEELHQLLVEAGLAEAREQGVQDLGARRRLLRQVADLDQHRVGVDDRLLALRGRRAERDERRRRCVSERAERLGRAGDGGRAGAELRRTPGLPGRRSRAAWPSSGGARAARAGNFWNPASRSWLRSAVASAAVFALLMNPESCWRSRASGARIGVSVDGELGQRAVLATQLGEDPVGFAQRRVGTRDDRLRDPCPEPPARRRGR